MISNYRRIRQNSRTYVRVKMINRIDLKRRIRLASYVSAPRLVKGFHNNPRLT